MYSPWKFIIELVSSCISISLFWFILTPPETWVSTLAIGCIWVVAVLFLILTCGLLCVFKGPFTIKEKHKFRQANPPLTIIIHTLTAIAWSYILFSSDYIATSIIYSLCIVSLFSLFSMYLYSKKPPPFNRMNSEDLYEYLCNHSVDYRKN